MIDSTKTRTITAHVPAELAQRIDALADRLDRSKDWIIRHALNEFLAQEETRSRLTREALVDVDTGNTLDHGAAEDLLRLLTMQKNSQ